MPAPAAWPVFLTGFTFSLSLIVAQNTFVLRQGPRRGHVGPVGARQPTEWRGLFLAGARLLTPWFARPAAWRVLDAVVAFSRARRSLLPF